MHELGVVFYIIEQVEGVVKENDLKKVESVTLQLGEVSTVIPSYLTDCWDWAVKKHDWLKEAALEIETIPAVTYCEDCQQTYGTVEHGKTCPYCGSGHTYLMQGQEFIVKEITAC
ncbi:MAG: hydrogenase maturation nickel metallochaperone HypA [Eubacteriales bacterium]|nr:hydrogenase maturation nickel metallochaperone HypA [Eubacteriales bacterium]